MFVYMEADDTLYVCRKAFGKKFENYRLLP